MSTIVDKSSFPHTRGDVQLSIKVMESLIRRVSPTRVGMYGHPVTSCITGSAARFPHTRGDVVSPIGDILPATEQGFPHTRGDVLEYLHSSDGTTEFPPHAWGCT